MSRGYLIAIAVLLGVIVLTAIGLLAGSGSSNHNAGTATTTHRTRAVTPPPRPAVRSQRVSLQLNPTAPVYVCLIGSSGRKLIDKVTIQPGTPQPVYRDRRFEVTLGNSSVTMRIDGHTFAVPPSNNPTGYVITHSGRHTLPLGHLPTCA